MTNRPKQIGTAGESAVRNFLVGMGWTDCHRLAQTGANDSGDLLICTSPRVIAEVKAGAAADQASAAKIDEWLAQTDLERRHAQAVVGVLVVRRFRKPPALWDVWLPLWAAVYLDMKIHGYGDIPVRMSLADFSDLLQRAVAA